MVALRGPVESPLVVQRRRLELIDRGIAGAAQPYHAAAEMPLIEAEAFLSECAEVTAALANKAVRHVVAELQSRELDVVGCCVLLGSGRSAGSLASTLASHTAIHTAEGEFYRDAIKKACECAGLVRSPLREKELWDSAERHLRLSRHELKRRVSELGHPLGPPWRQDEKFCALTAWLMLAG